MQPYMKRSQGVLKESLRNEDRSNYILGQPEQLWAVASMLGFAAGSYRSGT